MKFGARGSTKNAERAGHVKFSRPPRELDELSVSEGAREEAREVHSGYRIARSPAGDLADVPLDSICKVLGHKRRNNPQGERILKGTEHLSDEVLAMIGDAVLGALVIEKLSSMLRSCHARVNPSVLNKLRVPILSNAGLVNALNYYALQSEILPKNFPRATEITKANGGRVEAAIGKCFVDEGLSSVRHVIDRLFAPVFNSSSEILEGGLFVSSGGADTSRLQRLKQLSATVTHVLGSPAGNQFLKDLNPQNNQHQAFDAVSVHPVHVRACLAPTIDWLSNLHRTVDTDNHYSSLRRYEREHIDGYAVMTGRAAFDLCLKLYFIRHSGSQENERGQLTSEDVHRLWESVAKEPRSKFLEFFPHAENGSEEAALLQQNATLNEGILEILFAGLLNAGLLRVGVDCIEQVRRFDNHFCKLLIPSHRFAPREGSGLVAIGEAIPYRLLARIGLGHLDPTKRESPPITEREKREIARARARKLRFQNPRRR